VAFLLTNKINGKQYVGHTTTTIKKRFDKHCCPAKANKKCVISRAIKKYGRENFIVQELAVAYNQEELTFLEGMYICWFNTLVYNEYGYNVFSPITHSHSLSQQCKLPTTWEFWLEQDREFVIWADELYIVVISDYFIPNTQGIGYENGIKFIENSVGVQGEILIATEHGKPIKYVMYNSIENKWVICRKINETTYARTED